LSSSKSITKYVVKLAASSKTEFAQKYANNPVSDSHCTGIHTDFCTVGNFGSSDRLDYTIIGRGVNIASRLETLAEPGAILISYETYAHVRQEILCEEIGETEVKGLAYLVATYRVGDFHQNEASNSQV